MSKLGVILLSDLHASEGHIYSELCSAGVSSVTCRYFQSSELIDAVRSVAADVPPEERVLICSGDISHHCHSQQLVLAGKFLTTVADSLEIPIGHRFLVPGNHDIDWHLTALAFSDPWYDKKRQSKFSEILWETAPTFSFPVGGRPVVAEVPGTDLQLVLFDSPFQDRSATKPHHGRLGDDQISAAKAQLNALPPGRLRIAVLHHHVTPFGRSVDPADFSILQDASDVLKLAQDCGVAFILHGHQHRPGFEELMRGGNPIRVLGAGATTASSLPPEHLHTFHVILFDSTDPILPSGQIDTRILRQAFGWQKPIEAFHGAPACRPFGPVIGTLVLQEWVAAAIDECKEEGVVKLYEFLAGLPNGSYVSPHDFKDLMLQRLTQLGQRESVRVLHDHDRDTYELTYVEV